MLQLIEVHLLCFVQMGFMGNIAGSLILTVGEILSKLITIYTYAIIINAIASWIPQFQSHPITHIVYVLCEPLLTKLRRLIPLMGGIDLSPVIALLGLTL